MSFTNFKHKIMAKIRIEAEIEFNGDTWYSHNDAEELEWFISLLNDKKNTMVILHSNDVGDTIGQTFDFKWEIIK
jgi:hypothetical protein